MVDAEQRRSWDSACVVFIDRNLHIRKAIWVGLVCILKEHFKQVWLGKNRCCIHFPIFQFHMGHRISDAALLQRRLLRRLEYSQHKSPELCLTHIPAVAFYLPNAPIYLERHENPSTSYFRSLKRNLLQRFPHYHRPLGRERLPLLQKVHAHRR